MILLLAEEMFINLINGIFKCMFSYMAFSSTVSFSEVEMPNVAMWSEDTQEIKHEIFFSLRDTSYKMI